MPDLHGWITQQIDRVEAGTRSATPGPWTADMDDDTVMADAGTVARMWDYVRSGSDVQVKADMSLIIAHADPIAVLRRCAADRKILVRHRLDPDAYWSEAAMCQGCGVSGDCDWPVTDNLNDCPELLDLGEGYGLTPEILATLDRPERGERPEPSGRSVLRDSIASMYGALYKQVLETTFASISAAEKALMAGDSTREPIGFLAVTEAPEPSPKEKAMKILEPELKKIPGYVPTTNPEA